MWIIFSHCIVYWISLLLSLVLSFPYLYSLLPSPLSLSPSLEHRRMLVYIFFLYIYVYYTDSTILFNDIYQKYTCQILVTMKYLKCKFKPKLEMLIGNFILLTNRYLKIWLDLVPKWKAPKPLAFINICELWLLSCIKGTILRRFSWVYSTEHVLIYVKRITSLLAHRIHFFQKQKIKKKCPQILILFLTDYFLL